MDQISLCVMTRELCHQLYQGWENDPAIYMDMGLFSPYRYSKEAADRYFDAKQAPDRVLFAILKDGAPVGELQLKRIDRQKRECTLSVHMQSDAVKGRGYGTQAERVVRVRCSGYGGGQRGHRGQEHPQPAHFGKARLSARQGRGRFSILPVSAVILFLDKKI